jgi:ribosomal protein S18 acetylase RimI-like enzyme
VSEPADDLVILRAGAERIGDLQPLWEAMHRHHAAVAPEMRAIGPERLPSESWTVRRRHYEHVLAEPGAFALIAELAGRPVGYALVRVRGSEETWETGPVADLESLSVLEGHRGRAIGQRLVDAMRDELRSAGIAHWSVAVIVSNQDAIRFYERQRLQPYLVTYIGNV